MADTFDKTKRSSIMKNVMSRDNKSTELKLIQLFEQYGIHGWKRHYDVKGHPDFVFLRQRVAVFVDGCFWHGHNCRNTSPKDNEDYWKKKRAKNIQHDCEINLLFESRGWTVVRIWECELTKKRQHIAIGKLAAALQGIMRSPD